ncbi:MAG: hypothetical protein AB1758_27500, partial [Candidatus Eremiobacterota bacterium]
MTLAEVMAASFLLFGLLAVSVGILQQGLRELRRQDVSARALFLAQARLEEAVAEEAPAPGRGVFGPPFEAYGWKLTVQPLEDGFLFLSMQVTGPGGARAELSTQRRGRLFRLWVATEGPRLACVEEDGGGIGAGELSGQPSGQPGFQPAVSPDGMLAFVAAGRIWLRPAEGGAANPMTSGRE